MDGGRFLRSKNGHIWVTVFQFRLKRRLEDLPPGKYWFAMRFETLEDGSDVALTALFTPNQVAEMTPGSKDLIHVCDLDGKHLKLDGKEVWSDWSSDRFQFFAIVETPEHKKSVAWRWKLALEQLRGRPLQNIVKTRMAQPGEI